MWIFADLPFTYAIRVLDVYLLEGYKVLYRFAAAAFSHVIKILKSEFVISHDITITSEKLAQGEKHNKRYFILNHSLKGGIGFA